MDDVFDYDAEYVQDIFYSGEQTVGPLNEIGAIAGSPNLIINWDFRKPVNRNGELAYTISQPDPRITIDRWYAQSNGSGTVEIANCDFGNCIELSGINEFYQDVDMSVHNYPDFNMMKERYMTFSVLIRATRDISTNIIGIKVGGSWVSKPVRVASNKYEQLVVCTGVIPIGSSTITVSICPNGATLDIYAAKLEMGRCQSLVHQEYLDQKINDNGEIRRDEYWRINDVPNYELQYLLCDLRSHITDDWNETIQSNQNLLDNWYFINPINQKDQTAYVIADEPTMYSIDRWMTNSTVTIVDDGIQIGQDFWQPIDTDANKGMDGKKVTISVLIDGELYSASGVFGEEIIGEYISLKEQDGLYSFVFSGVSGTISVAKLELGNMQTLAHKDKGDEDWILNDLPPNRALELAKCQRYQKYISNVRVAFGGFENDHTVSTSIPLGEMRDIPSKMKFEYMEVPYYNTFAYDEHILTFYCVDGQNASIDVFDPEIGGEIGDKVVVVVGFFADANLYKEE